MAHDADFRRELGQQLRVDSIRSSDAAGSGHPTSSMSAADLMAVLIDGHLRLDYSNPDNPANDHLIFSKGHASPLYYAVLKAVGAIDDEELLTFRKLGSRLEGHPTPRIPPTDVATGSLGQGLPVGVGVAMAGRSLDKLPFRTWVLCGDSEMAEGSMWEAFQHAGWEGLDNLTAIIDVNRLGQTRETMLGWDLDGYVRRIEAFGWKAIAIDGHDVEAIEAAYAEAEATTGQPVAIVAKTMKGRGVKAVEDQPGKHGKPIEDADGRDRGAGRRAGSLRGRGAAGGRHAARVRDAGRRAAVLRARGRGRDPQGLRRGDRRAGQRPRRRGRPGRRGLQLHALRGLPRGAPGPLLRDVHRGAAARGRRDGHAGARLDAVRVHVRGVPVAGVRLRPHGRGLAAKLVLSGSHAGVSIGEDGPSQMALEDIASLRAIHGSTVLHPSDAQQTAKLVAELADRDGISFIRTLRGKTPVRTAPDEDVRIGGSRIAHEGDDVAIIACGITLDEAVKAAERLADGGVHARVLDAYSIKPIDAEAVRAAARDCGAIVTVEDHAPEGGLGDAVLEALAEGDEKAHVVKLAVREIPGSGTPEELLHGAKIDADAIADAAQKLVATPA